MIMKIHSVSKVEIRDYGVIKRADIKFKEGLNLIVGVSASGKTTVLNYLLEEYHLPTLATGARILFEMEMELEPKSAVLIDDYLDRLDERKLTRILNKLSNSDKQTIVTISQHGFDRIKGEINANIIHTRDFKLNRKNEKSKRKLIKIKGLWYVKGHTPADMLKED